jgi:hypothetical protein
MQQQQSSTPQTPDERRFLIEQAQRLQSNNQTCKIVTKSEHSIITGRVREASEGGVVFEAIGTGEQLISPWSNVAEFVALAGTQQSFSQAAGAGSGYYNQQRQQ